MAVASIARPNYAFLSAKCNGEERVTARKQIIQNLYEHFNKNQ
jgi:hypothetical protein